MTSYRYGWGPSGFDRCCYTCRWGKETFALDGEHSTVCCHLLDKTMRPSQTCPKHEPAPHHAVELYRQRQAISPVSTPSGVS